MNLRMHKAISVIQFKVEGKLILQHPEFQMEERALLHRIDYKKGTILLDGKEYPLKDDRFPTIDPVAPYELTEEEEEIMERLEKAFGYGLSGVPNSRKRWSMKTAAFSSTAF